MNGGYRDGYGVHGDCGDIALLFRGIQSKSDESQVMKPFQDFMEVTGC